MVQEKDKVTSPSLSCILTWVWELNRTNYRNRGQDKVMGTNLSLGDMEFEQQEVRIKIGDASRKFILREMSADRAVQWEEDNVKMIQDIVTGEVRPLFKSDDPSEYRRVRELIQEVGAKLLADLLIPQDGDSPATPNLCRKHLSYRHRVWLLNRQIELNGQEVAKDSTFLLTKAISLRLAQEKGGKIPRGGNPFGDQEQIEPTESRNSDPGSPRVSNLAQLLEAKDR